jgi:transposase-like protein
MDYPQKIRRFIYTTNQLERLMKEIKRRSKVIEVFSEPEAVYKVVYLGITEYERKVQSEKLIRIPGSHF